MFENEPKTIDLKTGRNDNKTWIMIPSVNTDVAQRNCAGIKEEETPQNLKWSMYA